MALSLTKARRISLFRLIGWSSSGREYFTSSAWVRVDESTAPTGLKDESYDWARALTSSPVSPVFSDATSVPDHLLPREQLMATAAELDERTVEPDDAALQTQDQPAADFLPPNYQLESDSADDAPAVSTAIHTCNDPLKPLASHITGS